MSSTSFATSKKAFPSKFADAGGIRTHYLDVGRGPTCILVHGGGAGADGYSNWVKTIPILSESCRVVAMDMLGFGQTEKPGGDFVYSQQARNDHLASFIEAIDARGATVVGNSMGGASAIGACVQHSGLIGKLVLMGSAGLPTELPEALRPIVNYDFTREGMIALMRALTTDGYQIDSDMVDYRVQSSVEPEARRAYARTMQWVKEHNGIAYDESFIASVNVPTLVVNGKQDKVVPLAHALKFIELIPRSWGYLIPDCGHWAMLEHVDDFAMATRNFIAYAK